MPALTTSRQPGRAPATAAALFTFVSFVAAGLAGASSVGERSSVSSCTTDLDCSLLGECQSGACVCDRPWFGPKCDRLGFADVPAVPAYGFGPPFATTSWGGNAIPDAEGTWHLFVTEIAGARCGLERWGNQSTVVHATSPNATGPYTRVATALPHEVHNPQAIRINGTWFLFHIGSADSAKPAAPCSNDVIATRASARSSGFLAGTCPAAPSGYTAYPAHCVGPDQSKRDCAAAGTGQITTGWCDAGVGAAACAAQAAAKCDALPACHSFALRANGPACNLPTGPVHYKLIVLGEKSTVANDQWVAYAKPGQEPMPPPSPPAPAGGGSTIHRSSSPNGPWEPVPGAPGCNNPSPALHPNGTLFLVCTWNIRSAPGPEGPWAPSRSIEPPAGVRRWEDPFLWIDQRGFHIIAHCYTMGPYPSIAFSGLGFSRDGVDWSWSATEPFNGTAIQPDGSTKQYSTMERPKLLFADPTAPTRPTHLLNGVSPVWNGSSADPCAACGHCSHCKVTAGMDWTYTLLRTLA